MLSWNADQLVSYENQPLLLLIIALGKLVYQFQIVNKGCLKRLVKLYLELYADFLLILLILLKVLLTFTSSCFYIEWGCLLKVLEDVVSGLLLHSNAGYSQSYVAIDVDAFNVLAN